MKNIRQSLKVVALSLILSFGISFIYAATEWTGPTAIPPNGNTDAPINTSTSTQLKDGALGVVGLFEGFSGAIFDGGVSIAMPSTATTPGLSISSATDEILKLTNINGNTIFKTGTDGALVINSGGKDIINIDASGNFNIKASYYDNQGFFSGQPATRCPKDTDPNIFEVSKFITNDPIDSVCYDWGKDQGVSKSKLFKVLNQNSEDLLNLSPAGLVINDTGLVVQGPITTSPGGFIFPDGKAQTTVPMSGYETIRTDCGNSRDCIATCSLGKSIISGGCYAAYDDSRYINSSWPNNANSWGCHTQANVTINAYAICANVEGQTMLVNNEHSEAACTVLGGTMDSTSTPGFKFCKFNQSSCPSTWTRYSNWSATSANTCTGSTVDLGGWPQIVCYGTSRTTGQHPWSNDNTIETSSYDNGICTAGDTPWGGGGCLACSTTVNTCSATRTQIGCF